MTNEADKKQEPGEGKGDRTCPFCDAPMENWGPLCKACGVPISRCSNCGKPLPKGEDKCPECGT